MQKITVYLLLAILVGCSKTETPDNGAAPPPLANKAAACLGAGIGGTVGGVPGPKGWKLPTPCCAGLTDRESIAVCGQNAGGGYTYTCLPCGNGACDLGENHCNCPEDCK